MSRLPIRTRLTLVFTVAMAVVLAAMSIFVYSLVASDLSAALDRELRSRAQDLSVLVERNGSLEGAGSPFIEHGETFAELLAPDGRVLDATPTIGTFRLLNDAELERAAAGPIFVNRESVPGLDEPARMLAVPLERDGRRLVLVAGATRENRSETLSSLRDAFLIGGTVALLLSALGGYLLAGAALRPIEAMRRRAAEISATSLHERLPVAPTNDEVARLGETLNAMLGRLEDGLERERRFVADASHELRTPLALLRTELELARRRPRTPDELRLALDSAAAEVDRLSRLAEDLLVLARADEGRLALRREPIAVHDLLETVARRFGTQIDVAAPDGETIVGDRLRLEQALGNLVDNAQRHGGGTIRLEAERKDGRMELRVADDGNGFPAALLPHAFDRFTRGDEARAGGGAGLGLALVDAVARAHGGTARAANRDRMGAVVTLELPA